MPRVIVCHGFSLSKDENMDWASDFVYEHYYSLGLQLHGQGNSQGTSNLISTTEMNDLNQVIQHVKNDQNTNDDRIGITGGSQGGIIPFMAIGVKNISSIVPATFKLYQNYPNPV